MRREHRRRASVVACSTIPLLTLSGRGVAAPPSVPPSIASRATSNPVDLAPDPDIHAGIWPQTDWIVGIGTAGPYYLSRTGAVAGSERLSLNGRSLLPTIDYTLDPATGLITFTAPLRSGDSVQAHYRYDAATSKASSTTPAVTPLDLALAEMNGTSVRLLGAVSLDSSRARTSQGFTSVGLDLGQKQHNGDAFSGLLLLTPGTGPLGSAGGGSLASRDALLRLGGQVGVGGLRLGLNWASVGKGFSDTKAAGAEAGSGVQGLTLAGAMARNLKVDAALNRQHSRNGDKRDDHVGFDLNSGDATVSLAHADAVTGSGHSSTQSSSSELKVQEKLGGATALLNAGQGARTSSDGSSTDQHVSLALTGATGNVALSRTVTTGEGQKKRDDRATTVLKAEDRMSPQLDLTLSGQIVTIGTAPSKSSSGPVKGSTRSGQIGVSLAPATGVSVRLVESRSGANDGPSTATHALNVAVGKLLTAAGSLTNQSGPDQQGKAGGDLSLKLAPSDGITVGVQDQFHRDAKGVADHIHHLDAAVAAGDALHISAHLDEKSARGAAETQSSGVDLAVAPGAFGVELKSDNTVTNHLAVAGSRLIGVEAGAHEPVKLDATLQESYAGKDAQTTGLTDRKVGAALSLDPASTVHFGAGYSEQIKSVTLERDRSLDARLQPLGVFKISGRYVERTAGDAVIPDTATLAVGFEPVKLLHLDASYTENPQDDKGKLVRSIQRALSAHATLGFLDLGGQYKQLDPLGAPGTQLARQFDLGLNFTSNTRLSGSYIFNNTPSGPDQNQYNYRVNFSQRMGDIFSLSVAGELATNTPGMLGIHEAMKDNSKAKIGLSARW